MKVATWIFASAVIVCGQGCSRLESALMSAPEKVNAAFEVSSEVRVARERLERLLAEDAEGLKAAKQAVETRLTVRGLECSKSAAIGRFDPVESVKSLALDRRCFQDHDEKLAKFLGIRAVGLLIAKPSLKPALPIDGFQVLKPGRLNAVYQAVMAREAGVAVYHDGGGQLEVVELPSQKSLSSLPKGSIQSQYTALSPNGRVVAVSQLSAGTTLYEAETGERLLVLSDATRVMAWMPSLEAFVYSKSPGSTMLADGRSGDFQLHAVANKLSAFAVHVPGGASRLLFGVGRDLQLIDHARVAGAIESTLVRSYSVTTGQGVTATNPLVMQSGKRAVFHSMRDIGWLDLADGISGVWKTDPMFRGSFAKLDETRLLISGEQQPGEMRLRQWIFDTVSETVALGDGGPASGLIVETGDRPGFMIRGNAAWIGQDMSAGEAQPLDRVVGAYVLQQQLKKLEYEARMSGRSSDGLSSVSVSSAPPPVLIPGMEDVPQDAQVHIFGVYEAKSVSKATFGKSSKGAVRVVLRQSAQPVVLVFASYEPVHWEVLNQGARIAAVLISGSESSSVAGTGEVRQLRIGRAYAYSTTTDDYAKLREAVMRYTGPRAIRSFQGAYSGLEFLAGGR